MLAEGIDAWRNDRSCLSRVEKNVHRNLWFALDSRRTAWTSSDPEKGASALKEIGKTLGQHYLGENWPRFESAFERGLLEKTLQLHWAVLKERLDN